MPLTREQIIHKELDYFKSPLAIEPAYITAEEQVCGSDYCEDDWPLEDKCVYKTEDGRKCAVGALIKPAYYEESWDADDGTPINMLSDEVLNYLGLENVDWLKRLQQCHDDCARQWNDRYEAFDQFGDHFGRFFLREAKKNNLLS